MKLKLAVLILFSSLNTLLAQGDTDQQLAQHYYTNGEFEKAQVYYEKLYGVEPSKFYFTRLLDCMLQSGSVKEAEKLIKKQISYHKGEQEYKVILAQFYDDHEEKEKAGKLYQSLIEELPEDPSQVIGLYNAFRSKNKNDLAMLTLEKGRKLLRNSYPLNFQFAEMYGLSGETNKMFDEYFDLLEDNNGYISSIQSVFSRQFDLSDESSKEFPLLKVRLLERIQKRPNETVYSEMLIWLYIQRKNFSAALTQTQALDRKLDQQGSKVMELGKMCVENHNYETARTAFKYIIELGEDNLYFYQAESALLNVRFLEITTNRNYSKEELETAIQEYNLILKRLGGKKTSIPIILELSQILAFYANRSNEAIELLASASKIAGLTDMQKAEIKIRLADIHVLSGDIWEASLLYMQIETDFKFEPIGHEAKFKNARIFYYDGEFDFAQSQLSVLKESTSKLIANDALQLSLLITDNFGLDSNYTVMNWFAQADLLIEQHRYAEAFQRYDSINKEFPYHSLADEILFRKGNIAEQQGKWDDAIPFYEELLKYHKDDILADDAIFHLAEIYDHHQNNEEKAIAYYKTILFDYRGSLYGIECRKRIRQLRGDNSDEGDIP